MPLKVEPYGYNLMLRIRRLIKELQCRWSSEYECKDQYFRDVIAKTIIFKEVEKIVTHQPWYTCGYRPNIVYYTIAKLARDIRM